MSDPLMTAGSEDARSGNRKKSSDEAIKVGQESLLPATESTNPANYREREQWANQLEFVFSCMAFSVGLGNVWRFPYLCFKNGGGAFLIPYFICLLAGGIPVYFLEVAIGQYWQNGGITVWQFVCPLFKGQQHVKLMVKVICL